MSDPIAKVKRLFPERLHDRLFLVGGMVRDLLLGLECQDFDLAAAVPPEVLTSLGFGLVEARSTAPIYFRYLKELGKVEITQLDSPAALTDDLSRRDFAVNAMAMTLDSGIIDPLGGQNDLEARLLRLCSPTSLSDDPGRIFRAFRFECEGWRLDADAEAALASRDWSEALGKIPVERFANEMLKALAKPEPGRFFRRLFQFGVGENILPEIFRMPHVPAGPPQHHPEGDLLTHSLQTLERMAQVNADTIPRFCAFFHDLGKLATDPELYPKHHGHEQAGARMAPAFCRRLRLPVTHQRALQAVCRLHQNANRWEELRDATRVELAAEAIKANVAGFLPQVVASDCGGAMPGWEETLRVASLNAQQLGVEPELLKKFEAEPEKCRQLLLQRRVLELRRALREEELEEG